MAVWVHLASDGGPGQTSACQSTDKKWCFHKTEIWGEGAWGVTFPTKLFSSAGTAIIFITFWQPTRFTTAFH